jgi:hypothetical protein
MATLNYTSTFTNSFNDIFKTLNPTRKQWNIDKFLHELSVKINEFQIKALPILRDYVRLQNLAKGKHIKYDNNEKLFFNLNRMKRQGFTDKQILETIKYELEVRSQHLTEIFNSRDNYVNLFKYFNENKERFNAEFEMTSLLISE